MKFRINLEDVQEEYEAKNLQEVIEKVKDDVNIMEIEDEGDEKE